MWLDDLNELVGRLKERIEKHKDVLRGNETATRYALIDPLLTALGWDLSDPGQVRTEYSTGKGRADYATFARGNTDVPGLVIEAKHPGKPTIDGIDQSINYCLQDVVPYFVVTNGEKWEAYDLNKPGKLADRRVVDFSLADLTQTTVMKMLWLWRSNFESESPRTPAVHARPVSQQTATPAPKPAAETPPSNPDRSDRGIPLDEFNPGRGDRPPAALLFPDGTKKEMSKWNDFQPLVVQWLVDTGHLTEAGCPVEGPKGQYLVVATSPPIQRNDRKFRRPRQIGSVWVDLHKDTSAHVKAARNILQARGRDTNLSDVGVVEVIRATGR